jgi:hypothetical protein
MAETTLHLPCAVDDVSDGYHTFRELYAHRVALFLALARALGTAWRAHQHSDGTMYDGWFIVGLALPTGDISYHLPLADWHETGWMHTSTRAPSWDGHMPADVVQRLRLYAALEMLDAAQS